MRIKVIHSDDADYGDDLHAEWVSDSGDGLRLPKNPIARLLATSISNYGQQRRFEGLTLRVEGLGLFEQRI